MPLPDTILDIERRLVAQATASDDSEGIFSDFCVALSTAGLPLWRASISAPAIDPTFQGASLTWRRSEGSALLPTEHDVSGDEAFERTPIGTLFMTDAKSGRWRLSEAEPDLPLLARFRREGATDYVLHVVEFAPGTALAGTGISFATDRPSGFTDDELTLFEALVPTVALAAAKLVLAGSLRSVLATYLGERTGMRVLAGEMRRGQGSTIPAVILLADLRGFTALSDRESSSDTVRWLNEHFDALGEPVPRYGGEVLKFLGDGFLAVFPVTEPDASPCPVCAAGLAAAREAMARNEALNRRRAERKLPVLSADIVLHFGQVMYGNVGIERRLDFTIIGPAVNEASRIEQLCAELGRPLLLSDAFAARCRVPLTSVGRFSLRGIEGPQRIWAPAEPL